MREEKPCHRPYSKELYEISYLMSSSKRTFLVAQLVKNPPAMQETPVRFPGWEDPLDKGKATHSSILAWRSMDCIVHGVTKSQAWLSNFHFTSLHTFFAERYFQNLRNYSSGKCYPNLHDCLLFPLFMVFTVYYSVKSSFVVCAALFYILSYMWMICEVNTLF